MEKIKSKDEEIEITTTDPSLAIPKSGKTKRKRSCKRKNKNLKNIFGQVDGEEVQVFNDGGGLIDSDDDQEGSDDHEADRLVSADNNV